jgi:hypothetical protein
MTMTTMMMMICGTVSAGLAVQGDPRPGAAEVADVA